jgi:hypothetical protein
MMCLLTTFKDARQFIPFVIFVATIFGFVLCVAIHIHWLFPNQIQNEAMGTYFLF